MIHEKLQWTGIAIRQQKKTMSAQTNFISPEQANNLVAKYNCFQACESKEFTTVDLLKTSRHIPPLCIKADFQSVLRTLESLFTTFVLFHVRRHKMQHFASTYMKQIQTLCQPPFSTRSFMPHFPDISLDENLHSCKNQ